MSLTWCTVYANRCTEYAIMYIRSFTGALHLPSSVLHYLTAGATLGCTTAEDIIKLQEQHWGVLQDPHLGVLHLTSSGLHILSCKSGASHGANWCTEYAIMYIRSLTWVNCIHHQVYCRDHHLTSGTTLGCASGVSLACTAVAMKCTAGAIIYHHEQHWGVL